MVSHPTFALQVLVQPFFCCYPPHCLKKNATLALWHWLRISITQETFISLDFGPDQSREITVKETEVGWAWEWVCLDG